MRKIVAASVVAVLLAGAAWADVNITAENFPDSTFRNYISNTFDTDRDGVLRDAELAEVKELPAGISYSQGVLPLVGGSVTYFEPSQGDTLSTVHDFTGIEYFTSLETLYYEELFRYGQQNLLSSVDLSHNTALKYLHFCPASLKMLDLSANTALLNVECPNSGLVSLDVSACESLVYLDCSSNDLAALDVSGNPELLALNCSGNSLHSLDVSANTKLRFISCSHNHLARIDLFSDNMYANCASQSITGSYVIHSGNAYEFDIRTIIPADEVTRITSLTAYDSANNEISITTYGGGGYTV